MEGTFNNIRIDAIQSALMDLDVETFVSDWKVKMLESRFVNACLGITEILKQVSRGPTQGGV